jgi:hypothetical protein
MDIPIKKDHSGTVVIPALFSLNIGMNTGIPISKELDFVLNTGYRYGRNPDDWNLPAWEGDTPKVDNSGLFLFIRIKCFLF